MNLLIPCKPRVYRVLMPMHKVPHHIVIASLLNQLRDEFGDFWWAVIVLNDGTVISRPDRNWQTMPDEEKLELIEKMATKLNSELHHGGHWVTVWTANDEWAAMFRDQDGDLQFTVSQDEPWARIRDWPIEDHCKQAAAAHDAWREIRDKHVGVRPDQTIKRALGQKPTSIH